MLRAVFQPFIRLFSSVTFGIVLLSLLFVYMSIGSAGILYPVHPNLFHPDSWVHAQLRQWRPFEMTEFEWFHWWPFDLLIVLIGVTIATTTIRRIPFKTMNYGVWMIHTGVLTLIVGSLIYFGTKVEGETPVPRRAVKIAIAAEDGKTVAAELLAMPGNRTSVATPKGAYEIEVRSIDPAWELLSGPDKGKRAYSVNLMVQSPERRFIRQVIAGFPQYTEDLIFTQDTAQPVKRALKETGKATVDDQLTVELDYAGQQWYYLKNDLNKSWAAYVRRPGQTEWVERPITGMPLYNDCIPDADSVFTLGDTASAVHPIRVAIPPVPGLAGGPGADPAPNTTLECTGFLRYAQVRSRWRNGSADAPINPVATVSVSNQEGKSGEYRLVARDPRQRSAVSGVLAMRYIAEESELAALQQEPTLVLRVPSANIDIREKVTDVLQANPSTPFRNVGPAESGYSYRVQSVQDDLPIAGRELSVAILEVRTPKGLFRRWVFNDPAMSRDVKEGESAMEAAAHGARAFVDDSIQVEYLPGNGLAMVLLIAGPDPNQLRLVDSLGRPSPRVLPVAVGTPLQLADNTIQLSVEQYMPRAQLERKPFPVPPEQRIRDARELFAMALIGETPASGASTPQWLKYHPYVFDRPEDQLRRYWLEPTTLTLADGSKLEVIFSRQRLPMPTPIALEDFELTTNIGGFSGATSSIRNYTSIVRFGEPGGTWSAPQPLSVNEPVEHGGLWYFQSQWDPPDEARDGGMASAGLNYTVLGVGNRQGVGIQLAGCILAVIGMAYAFYVKPIIRRRQKDILLQQVAAKGARAVQPLVLLAVAVVSCFAQAACSSEDSDPASTSVPFHAQVDLTPLDRVAVHTEGRLKSFGSFANSQMQFVTGPRRIQGAGSDFTYLDMLIRSPDYTDADVIYVKNKEVRNEIAAAILREDPSLDWRMTGFRSHGLISEALLTRPSVMPVLERLSGDLIRTAKQIDAIQGALTVKQPNQLLGSLKLIPPGDGKIDSPWLSIGDIMLLGMDPNNLPQAARDRVQQPIPGLDAKQQNQVAESWRQLVRSWTAHDASGVNAAVLSIADQLPQLQPDLYPERSKLEWESWYFRNGNMSWIWFVYMASIIFLLLGTIYRWKRATITGLSIFTVGFLLHTSAIALRWYISGRWPNSNMFEAVTTAAWMGTALAVIAEIVLRRTRMRGIVALGGATAGMVALMAAHYLPAELNPNIGNMMPVLHDVWLYIHTNVVIFSYALIFMAAVSALTYLGLRACGGPAVYARVGGAGAAIALASGDAVGAASTAPRSRFTDVAEVLDGVTMLLMELSFIMLWSGIVMGAIWADHSWGRPWGWDPKEVFALNTFIIFALLIHIRWKVRDKGLWTAVLTVIGAGVMLFNWIVINFVISGLHSYA